MSLSDLVFVVLALATVVALISVLITLLRRRWRTSARLALSILLLWAAYLAIGTVVALHTPQTVLATTDARCFDEICFKLESSERRDSIQANGQTLRPQGVFYIVTVRAFSQSQGRPQRESGAVASLIDSAGNRYWPATEATRALGLPDGYAPSLDAMLQPGDGVLVRLAFDVPASLHQPGLAISHSYAFNPARIIIGDQQHFLHAPTIIRLQN